MGILTDLADQISPGQQIMVEDGLPPSAIVAQEERREAWKGRKLTKPRDLKAPAKDEEPKAQKKDQAMKTEPKTKTSKADQVAGLRAKRAAEKGPTKRAEGKKAAKAKARTPTAPKAAAGTTKAIRPGSKLEIVASLLTRKQGCTSAEVLAATEWPAVSMPQQARAAGLTLRQEKDGKVTRYWGTEP